MNGSTELTVAVSRVADYLGLLPNVGTVHTKYPRRLSDPINLIVWAEPGNGVGSAHSGPNGNVVWTFTDLIKIEYHLLFNPERLNECIELALPMVDVLRMAMPTGIMARAFKGVFTSLTAITVEDYGDIGFGPDTETFGFRMAYEVTRDVEAEYVQN